LLLSYWSNYKKPDEMKKGNVSDVTGSTKQKGQKEAIKKP
jgi:hypothetical protein